MERSNYWIQTYTSGQYDFVHNYKEDVNLVDIAKSLSQQVRFVGHLRRPLSIAQHSLTVCAVLQKEGYSKEICLQGLMHDAHEAYTGDISRPYKMFLEDKFGVDFDRIENPIKQAISLRFGIDIVNPDPAVEEIDDITLVTEAQSLFHRLVGDWDKNVTEKKLKSGIKTVLGCVEAEDLFIKMFKELGGKV